MGTTSRNSASSPHLRAFTLVEVFVSMAIIGSLLAIALPMLARTMGAAKGFRCQVAQRTVAFDFAVFANDDLGPDRGNDTSLNGRFTIETFQNSQYGLSEFWRWGSGTTHTLPDNADNDPMRCAEVKSPIKVTRSLSCTDGGVTPAASISFGFNLRLHRRPVVSDGVPRLEPVQLSGAVLESGSTPLFWDVDGRVASTRGLNPVFSAPSLADTDTLGANTYWFPAMRHNGAANVAFIDGHVAASRAPLEEPGWNWKPMRLR
ncbi:MAG: prepilin-type N-terminal cleavage/methylation domain-containing protein [Phycisphaeraceae bacterium]|nr:prepilin-type N-terminal cleavage/methylation domain-containing protein [Phycisphaeraceae bacterium]